MPIPPIAPSSIPDWPTIADEILCPLCDYNLRGLPEPRCPECGYQFTWDEVLNPALRRHPYLFEHQPHRSFWSFGRTLTSTLRPRTFWHSLHPAQSSNLKRLLLYWLITALTSALPMLLLVIPDISRQASRGVSWGLRRKIIYLWYSNSTWGQITAPVFGGSLDSLVIYLGVACLLWPIVTFALLMIFQASMHKARIKSSHVLRTVIYSADAVFWIGPPLAACVFGAAIYRGPIAMTERVCWICIVLGPVLHLLMTYRLAVAYHLYLRFQHATATVLATQAIVILMTLVFLAATSAGWFR